MPFCISTAAAGGIRVQERGARERDIHDAWGCSSPPAMCANMPELMKYNALCVIRRWGELNAWVRCRVPTISSYTWRKVRR